VNWAPARGGQRLMLLLKGAAAILAFTAVLCVLAGRVRYFQAALLGLANITLLAILALGFGDRVGLLAERMKPAPNAKAWDRFLMAAFMPLAAAVIVIAALDGGRFRWTTPLPAWAYPPALLAYSAAAALHLWAILANEFYVSTVAVQDEKGHHAIDRGPYRFVRHPGYLGIIVMELTIPVILGSLWALVASGLVSGLLLVRAALEDGVLRRELAGYREYAARVRYRVIPGIW
jgi:protein-S-isoprenylcysteine O-methyltransferase Ste14